MTVVRVKKAVYSKNRSATGSTIKSQFIFTQLMVTNDDTKKSEMHTTQLFDNFSNLPLYATRQTHKIFKARKTKTQQNYVKHTMSINT